MAKEKPFFHMFLHHITTTEREGRPDGRKKCNQIWSERLASAVGKQQQQQQHGGKSRNHKLHPPPFWGLRERERVVEFETVRTLGHGTEALHNNSFTHDLARIGGILRALHSTVTTNRDSERKSRLVVNGIGTWLWRCGWFVGSASRLRTCLTMTKWLGSRKKDEMIRGHDAARE